jgi:hypothetical protein
MPRITGRLLADLHPNGTVPIAFIAGVGGGNETPMTARDLDAAEIVFMTCGLTRERAAAMRTELERTKVVSVETCVDDAVVAKLRNAKAQSESGRAGGRGKTGACESSSSPRS